MQRMYTALKILIERIKKMWTIHLGPLFTEDFRLKALFLCQQPERTTIAVIFLLLREHFLR